MANSLKAPGPTVNSAADSLCVVGNREVKAVSDNGKKTAISESVSVRGG
jgi:hypothetical protein